MADNLLTMDQYEEVKKILWPVRVQYKKLYIALGGNPAKLTTKTAKNDMDTTYYNILEMCLKKENISQDDVARALTSIGYGYLSDNVTSLKLQDLTEDGKMTCHHLSIIYSTLYPARTKHDNLGMRLGMDITDLEALSISNVDEAFSEMLTAVLSKGVTQGKLADALKSPIVSYSYLGEKVLHEKFSNAAQDKTVKTVGDKGEINSEREASSSVASEIERKLPGPYLTEEDFADVYNEIHTVCHKYYHIGLILGITPNNLDIIKVESDGNDSVALSKVLNEFLRRSDPKPTWKMLTDALASRTVGYGYLAATIHQKLATS